MTYLQKSPGSTGPCCLTSLRSSSTCWGLGVSLRVAISLSQNGRQKHLCGAEQGLFEGEGSRAVSLGGSWEHLAAQLRIAAGGLFPSLSSPCANTLEAVKL